MFNRYKTKTKTDSPLKYTLSMKYRRSIYERQNPLSTAHSNENRRPGVGQKLHILSLLEYADGISLTEKVKIN